MNSQEYSEFLKNRRTAKLFNEEPLTPDQVQMIADAVDFAPAQNSRRNFIPVLLENAGHKKWLQDNIFYMVSMFNDKLQTVIPKEYQMGVLTAPLVVLYLTANKNLPIVDNVGRIDATGNQVQRPSAWDMSLRNVNIGINMSFVANQAYLMGLDVGFVGCTRGTETVMQTPELKQQLLEIYQEYDLMELHDRHALEPVYAVCIGHAEALDLDQKSYQYLDGIYTNRKRHSLDPIERIRKLQK